jgi:hypothetical protein
MIASRRRRKHDQEQEQISTAWAKLASDLTRETDRLVQYAPWKNDQFLGGKDLVDADDMSYMNQEGLVLYQILTQNMAKVQEAFGIINMEDLVDMKAKNDAFIAKHSVNIDEWDKRYN